MTLICCAKCGIPFAVPEAVYYERSVEGEEIICPNGHGEEYGPREAEKPAEDTAKVTELRRELVHAIHRAEQAEARATEVGKKRAGKAKSE